MHPKGWVMSTLKALVHILGLDVCGHRIVGNGMLRCISGGKKRVTTGMVDNHIENSSSQTIAM